MKILVTDDHALIRDALRGVLKQLRSDASVFEASDSRQAMRIIEDHPNLDLILLDLNLPDRDGFSVLADLRERYPAIAIVVLSALQDRHNVIRALDLGALGFIPKTTPREVMLSALQLVFSGGIYIPAEILGREETSLCSRHRSSNQPTVCRASSPPTSGSPLGRSKCSRSWRKGEPIRRSRGRSTWRSRP
jgi:Response regulator containing a CheY-like receiver domain and an HTH DNA-binding domain